MEFTKFMKLLYPFCAAGEEEAEFVVTATSYIMKDSDNVPNPLANKTLDTRKRIFEGKRDVSKKDATAILSLLDKSRFEQYLTELADDALQNISDSMNENGFDTHLNNVAYHCAELFECILMSIISGEPHGKDEISSPFNNLPHKKNPYFTGREEILKSIQDNFKSKDMVSLTQSVTGLGGIGKTSVALEYAYSQFKKYETIWWVNAETEQSALTAFGDFATKKKIIPNGTVKTDEINEAVKNWFNNRSNKNWIFIFDNADADSFTVWLEKYLPQTNNGHVLITTRSYFFPKSATINIDIFNDMEALTFLKKRTRKSGEGYTVDLAKALAERLQYLPLALEQAAAYIDQTPGVTYQDYINLIDKYGVDVFKKKLLN